MKSENRPVKEKKECRNRGAVVTEDNGKYACGRCGNEVEYR
jgi:ribosomal protein S27AE